MAPDTGLFQGYHDNPDANASKYREGVYHSGDLGHMLVVDDKRFLYFDGRTDDWIRKDGENFSAAQVARLIQEHVIDDLALFGHAEIAESGCGTGFAFHRFEILSQLGGHQLSWV